MKTITFIFSWVLLFIPLSVFTQMTINAGVNQHICKSDFGGTDSIIIGGSPTVTGGIPPYTYTWSSEPIEISGSSFLYASDLLDDTTVSNPRVISIYPENDLQTHYFKLTVTDSIGTTLTDSVQVTSSVFFHHLLYYIYYINQGDSVYLNEGSNVGGGIGNLSYLWQPSHGLRDTTLFTGFWAKPDTTIEYNVTITDSMGCQRTGSPLYYIRVNHLNINNIQSYPSFNIYPNPANNFIIVETDLFFPTCTATLTDIYGKVVLTTLIKDQKKIIDTDNLTTGVYFISISNNKQILQTKKMVKE